MTKRLIPTLISFSPPLLRTLQLLWLKPSESQCTHRLLLVGQEHLHIQPEVLATALIGGHVVSETTAHNNQPLECGCPQFSASHGPSVITGSLLGGEISVSWKENGRPGALVSSPDRCRSSSPTSSQSWCSTANWEYQVCPLLDAGSCHHEGKAAPHW